jgi:hypothetical protein
MVNPIIANYQLKCSQPSDIHRHLPTLRRYARECESIAEFGVRGIVSTWAFLGGLLESRAPSKQILCVDIEDIPEMGDVRKIAKDQGIALTFNRHDSATCSIPPVDLLFIDTWHIYGHLKRELNRHHQQVRKYIVMHDTESDGVLGESLRNGWDIAAQARKSGYTEAEISCGLQRAISEFLAEHSEWRLLRHYPYNSGLTVLARPANVKITVWDRIIAAIQRSKLCEGLRRLLFRLLGRSSG